MRVLLSALTFALAVSQSQAQGLTSIQVETISTPMPLSPYGAQMISWALSPELIALAMASGSFGLQSLLGLPLQPQTDTDLPKNKLTYYWEENAPLTLCSKKTFQLVTMPPEPGSNLIITDLQLTEQGDYCADVTPVTPRGSASLYIYSDDGQIDNSRSTLTINDQLVPLAQLQQAPVFPHTQGNYLTLTRYMLEGQGTTMSTLIQLCVSSPFKRQMTDIDETDGDSYLLPPCRKEIYESGKVVAILPGNLQPWDMESVVIRAARKAGYEMDWHLFAGRDVVKTLGDTDACYSALMTELKIYEQNSRNRL